MGKQVVPEDELAAGEELTRGHKKKARTRQQLIDAALRIYARAGVGELALNALAEEAGVSNGTVYNYFRTREDVLEAVGIALAEQLSQQILAVSVGVTAGVERMAIGIRTFLRKAQKDRDWASALVSVVRYAHGMRSALAAYVRADLHMGLTQGDFKYANEELALVMVVSATTGAMAAIVEGHIEEHHDSIVAEMILLALGVSAQKAKRIAALPIPEAGSNEAVKPVRRDRRRSGAAISSSESKA